MTAPHPRDFHISAHIYWIEQALVDCYAIDFLSDRAQKSIVRFIAAELQSFYKEVKVRSERVRDEDDDSYWRWQREMHPFFERATLRHPLGNLFGGTLAKAIQAAVGPVYDSLEKGKTPPGAI